MDETNKRAFDIMKKIGLGWYFLILLLLFGWIVTFIMMILVNEFTLWPLTFFIAAVFLITKVGKWQRENGIGEFYDK